VFLVLLAVVFLFVLVLEFEFWAMPTTDNSKKRHSTTQGSLFIFTLLKVGRIQGAELDKAQLI
jgi:hypothetical protein